MMTTTIWTLLSIFVIAPLGALAIDRLLFGCHYRGIDRAAPPPALHRMEGGRVLEKNLAARASVVLQMLSPL